VSNVPIPQRPFVLQWARDSGIAVPRAQERQYLDDWHVDTRARRRRLATTLRRSERETVRALRRRMLVDWVVSNRPRSFGRVFDVERDAVQDVQMSLSPDQLERLVHTKRQPRA
jgi:hypothetical protein